MASLSAPIPRSSTRRRREPASWRWPGLVVAVAALVPLVLLSLGAGSIAVHPRDTLAALFAYDATVYEQIVVREYRVPRVILALVAGVALAVAGGISQAATRNPLAAPEILGVTSGAAFGVVAAIHLLGVGDPMGFVWFGYLGGLGAAAVVLVIASAGGPLSPLRLVLAGVITTSVLSSWTTFILLRNAEVQEQVVFWTTGALTRRDLDAVWSVGPIVAVATLAGLAMGRPLNVLNMGEETARTLGQRAGVVRIAASLVVVILAGGAVALAGPIAFVGLAVPHLVRGVSGTDTRWTLAYCAAVGPGLLLLADVLARFVVWPSELPVGLVTAMAGAPVLIWLVRRR